jgi:ribose 5-phosphate isomerase B
MVRIWIGSDRVGYGLKSYLVKNLVERGFQVDDLGPFEAQSVHYPIIASNLAGKVVEDKNAVGILICNSGVGMSIAANKIKGARAANCTSTYLAEQARAHNDANILCLGSAVTEPADALQIVDRFIGTTFEGGKHAIRVQMLNDNRQG